MLIGLLSDNHGYMDDVICEYLKNCDEIWHAGDIGGLKVTEALSKITRLRAVYGNIDDEEIRSVFEENEVFEVEGVKVFMTHIGGYPPRYTSQMKKRLDDIKPDIFICGHSHILKVIPDRQRNILHINPGACGHHGFHQIRTMVRFEINKGKPENLEVIELGRRGR